jgi:hypothetical protein
MRDPVFKEKAANFTCFNSLIRHKINLRADIIMQPIPIIYLAMFN